MKTSKALQEMMCVILYIDLERATLTEKWTIADRQLLRYMMYDPLTTSEAKKTRNVMLQGHTDFNSISTLVSQTVAGLQILMPDGVWRYVKHRDGALVINIGDQLSFKSGGILKGTIHRGELRGTICLVLAGRRHLR